jgi:phosphatidate cytidylyltransferase
LNKELKQRLFTGLSLLLLLILMFFSKIIFLFVSIIVFALSFIEFSKMSLLIYKKKIFYKFICNILFLFYLSFFFLIFIFAVNDIHLKIFLFIILLICIASDIGGITLGKLIKGPKLSKVSPNKTISGSLGSVLFSVGLSIYLLGIFFEFTLMNKIYFGIIISISVQLGDLFISYLKRKASIKNTGKLLPGHGGILDRIDGILLGVPIGLIVLLLIVSK